MRRFWSKLEPFLVKSQRSRETTDSIELLHDTNLPTRSPTVDLVFWDIGETKGGTGFRRDDSFLLDGCHCCL